MRKMRKFHIKFEPIADDEDIDIKLLDLRSKLGGKPDWEQQDETPNCPLCKHLMVFIGQIDSIAHDEEHNPTRVNAIFGNSDYMFGDVGMIYIFFCFDCLESKSIFQSS